MVAGFREIQNRHDPALNRSMPHLRFRRVFGCKVEGFGGGLRVGRVKINAAVLRTAREPKPYARSRPLSVEQVTLDPPGPGEVLIRISAAGVCHSDMSVVNGDRPRPLPMAIGHEAAGIVERLGEYVSGVNVGDHVVAVFVASCGKCPPCRAGRPALCEPAAGANHAGTLRSGARRLRDADGLPINHHLGCSAFAEYAVMSEDSLVKVDPDLPSEYAALFGCAVLTGVGAVVNTADLRAGQSIAIVGLGGVGLAAVLGAVGAGAGEIVAIDLNEDKLKLALSLGATHTIQAGDSAADEIREITSGGVEVAIETAGAIAALECAYRSTRRGGLTVTASLPNPASTWSVSPVHIVAEERTIRGSYIGSAVPSRDIPRYLKLFETGRLPVDRLLGERFALSDVNVALDRLDSGHALRQVVMMGSDDR